LRSALLSEFWSIADAVAASGLQVSIIRGRDAQPHVP
jgi:hypothetical protein